MTETRLSGLLIKTGSIPTDAIENFSGNVTASLPTGTVSSSTQVTALLPGGAISSSTQVNYTQLQNIPSGIASSSAQVTAYLPSGVASSSAQIKEYLPSDTVSGSIQIKAFLPDGTVSSSTQLPDGIASSSAQIKSYLPTGTISSSTQLPDGIASSSAQVTSYLPIGTVSSSGQVSYLGLSNIPSGIASSSAQITAYLPAGTISQSSQVVVQNTTGIGALATTGSNTFAGSQTITGNLTVNQNFTVLGSASIQYVSQSTLNIASNIITVNTNTPAVNLGGLAVIDSGSSPQRSGSLLFDSANDQWIFVHQNTAGGVTSSVLVMGPPTFNNVGSETLLTQNRLVKGNGLEHVVSSIITDDGTNVGIGSASPSTKLDVSGNTKTSAVLLPGSTSGTVTLQAAATAGTTTITFPATTGTVVTTGDSSTVTNTMLAGSIANAKLANSTISGISLGSNLATLTIGSGLTGTSYNGSTAVTISISSGAITNAMLANSTISGVALGSNLATLTLGVSGTGLSGNTTYNGSGAATFTVTSNATSANTGGAIVARDGSGNFSAGTITATLSGNASTATSAGTVTGTSGQLYYKDDRIIEPNSITSGYLQFGFTSFGNNNTSPWADYLHLRSYTDGSGGADNLVVFSRSSIAMRIYQQTWNSGTAYSSYKDVAFTDSNITGTAAAWTTARTITIGSTGKSVNGTADVSWTLSEIGAYSNTNPSGYTTNTGTVTSVTVSAGTGMSGGGTVTTSGTITLTNAGVTSAVAGTGITVSGATGAVTITNSGVTSVNGSTGAVTVAATNQTMYIGTTAVAINRGSGALSLTGVSIDGNAGYATTAGSAPANGGTSSDVNGGRFSTTAGSYNNAYTWIQFGSSGGYGLYFPGSGAGTHIYPNTSTSTYGSFVVEGVKNTYYGFMYITGVGNAGWMTNGNATGFYNHTYGWKYYHENGNFYIGTGTYGGGTNATALHSSNYSSYAIPVGGGINMSGGFGLNDQKLYLRTNGDTNHYIWNAADDWEELVFYTGTGFRIAGSNGSSYATVTTNGIACGTITSTYYNSGDGVFLFRYGSNSGVTRHINLSNSTTDPSASSIDSGITWGQRSDNQAYYLVYCTQENYNGNYNKLTLNWHTGIRIGASTYYGGTTFYDNSLNVSSTIVFSVGRGDSNVRATNTFYAGGDVVAYSSDARLKENIKPIDNPIDKIMKLNGVYYTWKDMVTGIGFTPTQKEEVGVLAQEVQEVLPEVVTAAPFDCEIDPPTGKTHSKSGQNYLTVKYEKLVPLLIEAIKEQQTTIQKLNSRIEALESK